VNDTGPIFKDDGELRLPLDTAVAGATVHGEMARGGMAIVYRATLENGKRAVLKVGTADAQREGVEERYKNEARIGDLLEHPNIVRPIAVGRMSRPVGFEGRMFLLTEFVDAPPMSNLLMQHAGGLPAEQVMGIGRQVSSALVAMHELGIVHRDLKPDNILVDEAGGVHIIDFGLAFSLGDVDGEERSQDLTLEGDAPGTPLYMSPQQAMHQPVSRFFDVYSIGVLLYEMCCGRAPHAHLPRPQIAAARSDEGAKPMSLTIMAPDTPAPLVGMIERCLAYDPQGRPTAEELRDFFETENLESRSTAPDLKVVFPPPDERDERELAEPTMLTRRPSVVAEGARLAGDETLVQLARLRSEEPSVPQEEPRAMLVLSVEENCHAGGGGAEGGVRAENEALESHGLGRRAWLLLILPLVAVIAGVLWVFSPEGGGGRQKGEGDVRPASAARASPSLSWKDARTAEETSSLPAESPDVELTTDGGNEGPPVVDRSLDVHSEEEGPEVKVPARKTKRPRRRPERSAHAPLVPASEPVGRSARCESLREDALKAAKEGREREVLRRTVDRSCWQSERGQRTYLRVAAYLQLRQYDACISEARGSRDKKTAALARLCEIESKD